MERFREGDNRLVSMTGSLRQVTMACHEVVELATIETIPLLIPNTICGMIIGKQGANIKKLESETGARLQMENEDDDMRKIMVSGEPVSRSHAIYLIASLISANESRIGVFDPRGGPPQRGQFDLGQNSPMPSREFDNKPPPIYRASTAPLGAMPDLSQQQMLMQMQQLQQLQGHLAGGMQGGMGGMQGMGGGGMGGGGMGGGGIGGGGM
eukprot:6587728-Pyramimonas_sp.AAC.1